MVLYAQVSDEKGIRVREIKSLDNSRDTIGTLMRNDGIIVEPTIYTTDDGSEWLYSPKTNTYYEYNNPTRIEPFIHIFKTVSAVIDPVCKAGLKLFSEPKITGDVLTKIPQTDMIYVTSNLKQDSNKNVFIESVIIDHETDTLKYKGWLIYRNFINNFNNILIGDLPGMCTLDGDIIPERIDILNEYIETSLRPRVMFRSTKKTVKSSGVKIGTKKTKKAVAAKNKKNNPSTIGRKKKAKKTLNKSLLNRIAISHPSIVQNSYKFPSIRRKSSKGYYLYNYEMNYSNDGLLKDMDGIYKDLNIITRGIHSTYKKNLEKYNRFKLAMPDDILTKGFAHVFFTRPDCNILTESNKLTSKVSKDANFLYAYNHRPSLLKNLCQGVGNKNHFNLFLSNKAQSFSLSDENITTDTYGTTFKKNGVSFGRHSIASRANGNFDITYTDNRDLDVFHFHKLWTDYISNVYTGKWTPKLKYLYNRIIDYACSVYYILTAEDGETIIFWSKYYGVFPENIPSSSYSWAKGNIITAPELNIRYQYSFKEDFNPLSLIEFNINSLNGKLTSGNLNYAPTYNDKLGHVGNTWVGAPFVETIMGEKNSMNLPDYTMKLRFKQS